MAKRTPTSRTKKTGGKKRESEPPASKKADSKTTDSKKTTGSKQTAASKKATGPKQPAAAAKKKTTPTPAAARKKPAARKPARSKQVTDLATAWNDAGRAYFTEYSSRLTRYYGGGERDVNLNMSDPRPEAMGDQVIRAVIDLNAQGDWQRAREQYDPGYSPLLPWIQQNDRTLEFVTILGPDELLVRRGAPWQPDAVTFHLRDGIAVPIDDIRGMCRSRGRDYLVLARAAGLEVRDARAGVAGFGGPPIATVPWPAMDFLRPRGLSPAATWEPDPGPLEIEQLEVSDDGMRIVVSCYRQGILLASRHADEPRWTLLWPDARQPYNRSESDDDAPSAGDMTHVAISRDGSRLAWGCQDVGHFLAEIGAGGDPAWYATVGNLSEYPHRACFSDDARYTALNSCHFYNGATIAFDWEGNRGVTLDEYSVHDAAPCIDNNLRVYAACWLDRPVVNAIVGREASADGVFALAGSGILRMRTVTGAIGAVQGFGSSAGSIDFCPESKRLALSSYSGFIHIYDPYAEELPGRVDGYRPRREIARWVMWEHLPGGPIRW